MKIRSAFAVAGLVTASGQALAHPGHEAANLLAGFVHPLGGFDYLLVMLVVLAVGFYAAR